MSVGMWWLVGYPAVVDGTLFDALLAHQAHSSSVPLGGAGAPAVAGRGSARASRAGLESACYTTRSGADYVVVHNPAGRAYARLDPREFELLPLMDGQHSVKELVIAYYQRYGVLALARVAGLVRLLSQQRFCVSDPRPTPTSACARACTALRVGACRSG